jgi:Lipin/Ned1/Smp2 multi-domain protein middle domain
MSLCGHIISDASITGGQQILRAFEDNKVTFEQFCTNPKELLQDSRLVIRIEDQYYDWKTAAPFIISMLAFKQPIPNEIVGQPLLVIEHKAPSAP